MKTTEEIIAYLQEELAEACELRDMAQDKQERFFHLVKVVTIKSILKEIER